MTYYLSGSQWRAVCCTVWDIYTYTHTQTHTHIFACVLFSVIFHYYISKNFCLPSFLSSCYSSVWCHFTSKYNHQISYILFIFKNNTVKNLNLMLQEKVKIVILRDQNTNEQPNIPKLKDWAKWIEIQRCRNTYYIFLQYLTKKKITPYTSQLRCHLAVGTEDHGKVTMMLGMNV